MEDQDYIYGRNAIFEAINSGKKVSKVFLAFGVQGGAISSIFNLCKKNGIPIVTHDKTKFNALERTVCQRGEKSQGIIALMTLIDTCELEDLLKISQTRKYKVLIALDEITDPHNLGAIARSAECSGASGLILPERNSAPITPAAIKASAGALNHLKVAAVGNLANALEKCKEAGFWIVGTDMNTDKIYTENIYDRPIVIVIGSEGKGIRPVIRKQCDYLVKIPMLGKTESLNASVSAGIILFEALKQNLDRISQ